MTLLTLANVVAAAALAVGFILGWFIGRRAKTVTTTRDAARDAAYHENAQRDFEFVRDKANEILRLAHEIVTRATRAPDLLVDPHRSIEEQPKLDGAITTGHFDPEVALESEASFRSTAGENTGTDVVNASGSYVGNVKVDGDVIKAGGTYVGRVKPDRDVVDSGGAYVGRVKPDGDIVDRHGSYVGRTKPDGDVLNASGTYIGRTKPPRVLHGGAAGFCCCRSIYCCS